MAITKMMHMKAAKSGAAGSHLKNAIEYILKENKVAKEGEMIYRASQGCMLSHVYDDMTRTKQIYGKEDGRQGYHFIISFKPGEVTKEQLWNITQDFVKEYLTGYEVVYAMHDDVDHLHTHIIFNSVSYMTGYKYHYNNGDWERDIQPVVDGLCMEYGAPVLQYHVDETYQGSNKQEVYRYSKKVNWTKEIKEDIDGCIRISRSWDEFTGNMKKIGYRFRFGKSVSVRKPGMGKARRLKETTMGFDYTPEGIVERINFRTGRSRLQVNHALMAASGVRTLPDSIRAVSGYKKYKDMSFEEKVRLRQILRIRAVIPEYKHYPGAWAAKRKSVELQRAAQELLIIKKYDLHSAEDIRQKIKSLQCAEREIKNNQKKEYIKYRQAEEISTADEMSTADKMSTADEMPYSMDEISRYLNEYPSGMAELDRQLDAVRKQKRTLYRLQKKYEKQEEDKKKPDENRRINLRRMTEWKKQN